MNVMPLCESPPQTGYSEALARGQDRRDKRQGAELARFMELRGCPVAEAGGILWYGVKLGLYMSLPYQLTIEAAKDEINEVIRKIHGLGVRFPSQTRPGLASGLYVYNQKSCDIHTVHRNFRSKIRIGLERCTFRRIEEDELLREGLALNLDTMQRQERFDPEFGDEQRWRRFVRAVGRSRAITATGAYVNGRLSAYAVTCLEDRWLHILHRMSRNADLEHCPNHALSFILTQEITRNHEVAAVSMGFAPLVLQDGLHEYKRRLGYELLPLNSVIQFHPVVAPLLTNRIASGIVSRLERFASAGSRLHMAAATLNGARMSSRS